METLNWESFKTALLNNTTQYLQFQYAADKWVDASYHITEIKQAPITSVDCGGVMNNWTEVIVQLWEPVDAKQDKPMKVEKALSIINLVEKALPLDKAAIVKIEFGNSQFDTRQMVPSAIINECENLIIDLRPDITQCKAINRGGSCGTTDTGEECCTPAKPKLQLVNLATTTECCKPGSACC
ncbi:hypothetical protein FFF34_005245 [Inquilinus sp. KBS0705]|nr:hypothetical protein FFF34_005245 [Inquilinus sp. KBS0705]